MSYLVLARKWRPQRLSDLTGQESIARILKNSIASGKVAHAYIFSGPRGVGKTSTARILAKTLNCYNPADTEPCGNCPSCISIMDGSSLDVIEIDGASNNGVDNIRELRENVKYAPSSSKYKIYIIDEAHMLSTSAFNAFLKTIEEPPPHVIFVLATTEPRKIPATVLSRCQHLPFKRIASAKIRMRLKEICHKEGFDAEDYAIDMIARMAEGSMRDSLTILDQIVSFSGTIGASELKELFGLSDTETLSALTESVIRGDQKGIVSLIQGIVDSGADIKMFTRDLIFFLRRLLIRLVADDAIDMDEDERAAVNKLSEITSLPHTALLMNELIKTELALRQVQYPRIVLEMALIKMAMMSRFRDIDEALRSISMKGSAVECYPLHDKDTRHVNVTKSPKAVSNEPIVKERSVLKGTTPSQDKSDIVTAEKAWNDALDMIEKEKALLALALREGTASFSAPNTIHLSFSGGASVHIDTVNDEMPFIKTSLRNISGREFNIEVASKEGGNQVRDIRSEAMKNPVIKEVLSLYEGIIVDVKENKK